MERIKDYGEAGMLPVYVGKLSRNKRVYYLCCAEGGTSTEHSQVIFRSKKADGLYSPWRNNPILTQLHLETGGTE